MKSNDLITIIRTQIQDSWFKKEQVRERLGSVEKNLKTLIESMEEVDDRRVSGVDISRYKDDLELFLKKHFDLTDRDLETEEQKERFELELKRAKITIELEELENRIANFNKRIMLIDTNSGIFGPENYEPRNLETYTSLITLEKALRDLIMNTFESNGIANWWDEQIPKDPRTSAEAGFDDEMSKFEFSQNEIRKIDFLDFSAYEEVFKGRTSRKCFFNGSEPKQWAIITKLSDIRLLRNKIVHRPPLDDEELEKFRSSHSDIMSFVKKLEEKNIQSNSG